MYGLTARFGGALAAVLVVILTASGCGGASATRDEAGMIRVPETVSTTTLPPMSISSDPAPDSKNVSVDKPVSVSSVSGFLKEVTLKTGEELVTGDLNSTADTWKSTGALVPNADYQLSITATDLFGEDSVKTWKFSTGAPAKVFKARLGPGDNVTVGVGMPITVKVNTKLTDEQKKKLVSLLTVTTTPPQVGGWRWFEKDELHWRPKEYWKPGTAVSVDAKIAGFNAGGGAFGVNNVNIKFSIGDANVSVADTKTHQMTVSKNGAVVRTMPISAGKPKFETRSGIHVVNEKMPERMMDSATVGIPRDSKDGYYKKVLWDVRISNSGEFVHAAPWSVDSQGNSNVSHGCINVSTDNAKWFYDFSQPGDVVQVTGTSVQLEDWNAIGDWQVPWEKWTP